MKELGAPASPNATSRMTGGIRCVFYSREHPVCDEFRPIFERLQASLQGRGIQFQEVDVSKGLGQLPELPIKVVPALALFDSKGRLIDMRGIARYYAGNSGIIPPDESVIGQWIERTLFPRATRATPSTSSPAPGLLETALR